MHHHTQERYRDLFEQQRGQLLHSQKILDSDLHVHDNEALDEIDHATTDIEQSMRMKMRDREFVQLQRINAALRRIELGKFGDCEQCEDEIELKRLEARPTAVLCIACQEEEERAARTRRAS